MNFNNSFKNENEIVLDSKYSTKVFKLYENHILIKEGSYNNTIYLDKEFNIENLYYVEVDKQYIEISKHNLFDSDKFINKYNFNGELGCIFNSNNITFKVWSPTKSKINLNIYQTGHEQDLIQSFSMIKNKKGVFEISIDKSFNNFYYTYSVFDNLYIEKYVEVNDIYSKSCGVNGIRGLITDLSSTINLSNLNYVHRKFNEAIVYELHIRDLSTDDTFNGSTSSKGKFLGLIEEDTTLTQDEMLVSTGFNHIKKLGVTDVQLLPIFDAFMVDESRLEDPSYHNIKNGIFNWGYMGLNFNTLEGSYSTNPYDGLVRVNEFKSIVKKYSENNIGIIMDVVYNHTAFSNESNFNILVPGYYHRLKDNQFSNGSGCGNETASERYMMSKFIIDSMCFWAKEYHLSGFRFDLMQIHDINTLNKLQKELRKINPNILIYGEPWNGGNSPLSSELQASKRNLYKLKNIGAFNDEIRDGVRGSVFIHDDGGFVQGNASDKMLEQVKYGIVGGCFHKQIDQYYLDNGFWHSSVNKCVNYASAHDNHTLWDKLTLSTNCSIEERKEMLKQINAIIILSQGLTFLHAGVEFARSKPNEDGSLEENSYESSDYTNKIRWSNKIVFNDVYKFTKDLIKFKRNNKDFILCDKKINTIEFLECTKECISYSIDNKFLIIHNISKTNINLLQSYDIIMKENKFNFNKETAICGDYILKKNSSYIFKPL